MNNDQAKDISIIIVSWNVGGLLQRALKSIEESLKRSENMGYSVSIETIVVDNASSDGSAGLVRLLFPHVKLIANDTNKGFGAANNQGLKMATGRYIIFLNPDAVLIDAALWQMYAFMEEQPFVGLIGPKLINPDGTLQRSCRRFPTFWSAAMILLKLHNFFPASLPIRRYYMWAFEHKTIRRVDQIMGACMMARRDVLDEVGDFDQKFYIFFEEADLCKRINNAGYIIFFYPNAIVEHRRSSSFVQKRPLWRQWHFAKSYQHYFWKHHNFVAAVLITGLSFASLGPAVLIELINSAGIRLNKNPNL
ncbi:hypothetical protein A3H10_04085 [Candidatus Uhrbacteria bacterium RIFCSPLOWO2_12_FULL_46_10]|uniref:Glycosyltransferase 2-like domain-containing protein n=1 Tax=Candidatus Uhrbacteria bacterium RIFCSPLOWO2_01_FULL_47_25 TaxID=1802402 RepID=A0A1F7UY30_9BACT|nr:MAG: Glycosyl transferase, family 2 [Parcubacteria group bacterium GW2011_GWA2_46_9]OGL61380.1 MAG: hypothetical protein A2752_01700 [Candidatus Uhrbacteria bacterium RIFCSPHIGHO2_01_FULL_46_23]OGL70658.1 MAG: hypothetical protein A3D60_04325 [Candidatus Uhrbacteria bacterium RIFCSPHIGHO2_02_FULL_47_29]OGL76424.1 MAG: hypothetical protein A3E96_02345 [Candidatus Uhrbacteria bacterium RIFCSPHIGHO2_12_FULL_46_13]OGL83165.1 MAG: hypothetical protein A2936_01545 [Candidatus Uhrbacteria bacterium